jgi:hypothetical protein
MTYSADKGMTWGEWVESENNNVNAILHSNGQIAIPGYAVVAYDYGSCIDADDMIVARHYLFST